MIDRLAAYAAREAENEDPEETKKQEEAAARRLAERVQMQKERAKERALANGSYEVGSTTDEWGSYAPEEDSTLNGSVASIALSADSDAKGKDKDDGEIKKFRGIPVNVKLFEVFWHQVVELIKVSLQ